MTATSVTGKGAGASDKPTLADLAIAASGPVILIADVSSATTFGFSSPPSSGNTVRFPSPLPGGANKYVVSLTSHVAGLVYLYEFIENGAGDFIGFSYIAEAEGEVHYLVVKKGYKPSDVR
jgi:hypothetical protein